MALGFAIALIALSALSVVWRHEIELQGATRAVWAAILACAFLFLGFLDDAWELGPRLKFIVFGGLSIAAALLIGVVRALPLGAAEIAIWFPFAVAGTALWVFTLVNCVNFMDGANGLAMGSMAIGLVALAVVALLMDAPGAAAIAACTWAASAATAGSGHRSTDSLPSFSGTPSAALPSRSARARKSSLRSQPCNAHAATSNSASNTASAPPPHSTHFIGLPMGGFCAPARNPPSR